MLKILLKIHNRIEQYGLTEEQLFDWLKKYSVFKSCFDENDSRFEPRFVDAVSKLYNNIDDKSGLTTSIIACLTSALEIDDAWSDGVELENPRDLFPYKEAIDLRFALKARSLAKLGADLMDKMSHEDFLVHSVCAPELTVPVVVGVATVPGNNTLTCTVHITKNNSHLEAYWHTKIKNFSKEFNEDGTDTPCEVTQIMRGPIGHLACKLGHAGGISASSVRSILDIR